MFELTAITRPYYTFVHEPTATSELGEGVEITVTRKWWVKNGKPSIIVAEIKPDNRESRS